MVVAQLAWPPPTLVEILEISCQDPLVVPPLQGGHLHAQDALILGRQALLNVLYYSAQQVRFQSSMQLSHLCAPSTVPQEKQRHKVCVCGGGGG